MTRHTEEQLERCYIRRIVMLGLGAVMLGAGLLGFCSQAQAQDIPLYTHVSDDVTIKLMPSPCVDPTTSIIIAMNMPPEAQSKFRHLESSWVVPGVGRRDYPGCWMEDGDYLFLIFSDATAGRVTKKEFTKRKGVTES